MIRSTPEVWARYLGAAHTMEREFQALLAFEWDPKRYGSVKVPTLLLTGELTKASVFPTLDELREAIPHAEQQVFQNQRHIALATDAQAFAKAVLAFTAQH